MSTERVIEEREVTFLVEPKARYVSLVTRGANQIPFKIVKMDNKTRRVNMKKTIQTLIVPSKMENDEILKWVGEDAADALKLDSTQVSGEYKRFVQLPADRFKADSMSLVTLDDELGIKAICGELKDGEDSGVISKIFKRNKLTKTVAIDDDAAIEEENVVKSISYDLYDEIYAMENAVVGILSQEMGSAEEQLSAVTKVIDNFLAYLASVLSVTKGQALIREEKEEVKVDKKEEKREEMKDEEVEGGVATDNTMQAEDESVKGDKETPEEPNSDQVVSKLTEEFEKLSKMVETLSETVEKMQKRVPGVEVSETREQAEKSSNKGDIFSGVLFR